MEEVKKKNAALAATLLRKENFRQSLNHFANKYPIEMIRAFFDYWTEMNKSCTKMRFEQQPTWETTKRLATWASRSKQFNTNGTNEFNSISSRAKQERDYEFAQYIRTKLDSEELPDEV